jgi:hypothetical protein
VPCSMPGSLSASFPRGLANGAQRRSGSRALDGGSWTRVRTDRGPANYVRLGRPIPNYFIVDPREYLRYGNRLKFVASILASTEPESGREVIL